MIRRLANTFSTCCTLSKASKDGSTPQIAIFARTEKRRITRRSREPSVSTRVPDDSDEPDELDDAQLLGSPPRVIKEIDKARVKRNLIKMRVSVRRLVRDLKNFNGWALQKYKSAGNCFTEVAGHPHANHVMLDVFVNRSAALGFDGNSEDVFYGLSEAFEHSWDSKKLVVTRSTFTKRLSSMGSPLPNLVHPASDEDDKVEPRMAKMRLHKLTKHEISQLIFFRNFVEPLFGSPGQVFDAVAGEDCVVDESGFVAWLATYHYPGDSNKVYHCFCEQGSIMTRFVFCDVLGNCKKLDPQQQDQNAPQMDQSSQNKVEPNHANAGHSTTISERKVVEQITHDMKPLKETPGDSKEEPGANDNAALMPSGENRDEVGTPARTLPCPGESRHTVHIQIPEEEGKKKENRAEEDDGDVTKNMEKSRAAFAGEDRISDAASVPPMEVDHIDLQGACDVSPQASKCEDDANVTPTGHRRRPSLSCTDHNDDEASSKTPSQAAEGTAAVQGKVAQDDREDSGKLPSQVAESPPGEKGKLRRRSLTSIDHTDREESIKAPLRRTSSAPPGIEQYDHKGPGKAATAAARLRKALTATAATAATRFASFRWRRKSKGSPDENIQGVSSAPHPQVAKSGEDVPKSEAPPQYSTEASTGGDQNAAQTTEDSGKVITRRSTRRKTLSSIGPEDTEATVVTRRSVRRKSLTSLDTDDIEATAITRRPGRRKSLSSIDANDAETTAITRRAGRRKSLTTIDPDDAEAAIKVPTHGVTKVTSCEAPASVDQGHLAIPDDAETASEVPAKDARRRSKSSTSSGAKDDVQDSGKSVSPDARGGGSRPSKTSPGRRSRRSMTLLANDIQDDLQDSVKSVTPQDDLQDSDKHASPDARGGGRRSSKTSPSRRSKKSMTLLTGDIQQDLQDVVSSETPTAKGNERRPSKPSIDQDEIEKSKGG